MPIVSGVDNQHILVGNPNILLYNMTYIRAFCDLTLSKTSSSCKVRNKRGLNQSAKELKIKSHQFCICLSIPIAKIYHEILGLFFKHKLDIVLIRIQ